MPDKYLVGLDIGGTFVKAVVFAVDGRELGTGSASIPVTATNAGWSDIDPDLFWDRTSGSIRAALAASAIDPRDIAGVGLSGTGNGLAILDASMRTVRPIILSSDTRAAGIVEEWQAADLPTATFPVIRQGLWSGQPAALLAWFARYEPATYARVAHAMLCKDWVRHRLTGEIGTDLTDATAAGLTDVVSGTYAFSVFEMLGLRDLGRLLPPIAPSAAVGGRVTEEAAAATGLMAGTPVAVGLFDCAATAVGAGCLDPGQVCLIVGTWSINEVVIDEPILAPSIAFETAHAPRDRWLLLEASQTSATNLAWYLDQFGLAESEEAKRRGTDVYSVLDKILASTPVGAAGVSFHPYLRGSVTNPAARAAVVGLGAWHDRSHVIRAVYEGIAFSHLDHVARLREVVPVGEVRLTGGGSRSAVWSQMFADILGVPAVVPPTTEAGACGAAIDAAVAVGLVDDHAAGYRRLVSGQGRRYEPDPAMRAAYDGAHELFAATADALAAVERRAPQEAVS